MAVAASPEQAPRRPTFRHVVTWRRHPVLAFFVGRFLAGVLTLAVVSVLVFAATSLLPGDVASAILGQEATPESIAIIQSRLGLDRPFVVQYAEWASGLVTGDLGDSAVRMAQGAREAPIAEEVGVPLRNSFVLGLCAMVFLVPLSMLIGTLTAVRAGRLGDHATSLVTVVFSAIPEFVMGALLIFVFFKQLGLFPPVALVPPGATPLDDPSVLVLPVATIILGISSVAIRQVRAGMIRVLDEDYVAVAIFNGIPRGRVLWRYGLRNALAPSVMIYAQSVHFLLGGLIITESVFAYPGIGTYLVDAVATRDLPVVASVAMILAAIYIVVNIVADFLVVLLVPKVRTAL